MTHTGIKQLRSEIRARRRHLSATEQLHHAQRLARHVSLLTAFRNSNRIALYLANDGEIDPSGVMQKAREMHKQVYLPVLSPVQRKLYFAPAPLGAALEPNRFGIPEPVCTPRVWLKAWQLDAILLPLVAFDPQGNRVGMGGGFYDRSLAFTRNRRHWQRPHLIGLAHECQKVDALEVNTWDVPLNAIVTEAGVYET